MGDANLRVSVTYCYNWSGQWPVFSVQGVIVAAKRLKCLTVRMLITEN